MPTNLRNILIWTEAGQRYGIALEAVQKVVRMVAITSLPGAPPGILGLINVAGRVLPVLSLSHWFPSSASRAPGFNDQLILAQSSSRGLALVAQEIQGLAPVLEEELAAPEEVGPNLPHLRGVLKHPEGLVLLPNLEVAVLTSTPSPELVLAHPGGAHGL